MPVHKDAQGRRYVEASVEVPGSPEQVWDAVATGPGISAWFVPTTVDGRVGGAAVSSFGPGMDSAATITAWDPPRSYIAETEEEPGKVTTEWSVEPRAGGTCIVRVVHRWSSETDDMDALFEQHAYGWSSSFFRILNMYLTHFPGQPCSAFQLTAFSNSPVPETWQTIIGSLTIDDAAQRAESQPGTPALSGTIEKMVPADHEVLIRLDTPAPGFAHLFVMPMGEQTLISIRSHHFGPSADNTITTTQQQWHTWLADRFTVG